jgi:hypothetical protein
MSDPAPTCAALRNNIKYVTIASDDLNDLERELISVLVILWKIQGKRHKIINLNK